MKDRIGRYTIIRELGRGGMATVYLANDPNFGRDVAIKVLPSQFLHDPQFRARFEREAKTIAALEHPAIVPVYDFGEQLDQPYIVMRYMQGGDLAHKLGDGALSLVEVATIINRLAAALDSAHDRKIIHRDLKPGNILFDQYDNAYLSDFGIVKLKEQNATFTGNAIIGTPTYMSPEQAKGDKAIDGRSDLYALGVIIYEMLTGAVPYKGNTPVQQMMRHILDPVPRILDANANLPASVGPIVERVLAKDPAERFANSIELAEALNLAAGLGSSFHRLPPSQISAPARDAAPSRNTILDDGAYEDEGAELAPPPVGSQTVLDDAAYEDELDDWEEPLGGGQTVIDEAAYADELDWDEPVGSQTVIDESAYEEPQAPRGGVSMGATVLDSSDAGYTLFDDVPHQSPMPEPDDFFTEESEPVADEWLTLAPAVKKRPPTNKPRARAQSTTNRPKSEPAEEEKRGIPIPWIVGGIIGLLAILGGVFFATGGGFAARPTATVGAVAIVTDEPTEEPPTQEPPTREPTLEPTLESSDTPTAVPIIVDAGAFGGGGNLIAFQTQQGNGTWNIGVMDLDGSNRVILTDDASNDMRPRWSPDGTWLVFRSDRSGNEDIWMMRPDGSGLRQLTTQPLADHTGTFSPDGSKLAYHADFDGEGVASIALLPLDGGESQRLTTLEDDNSYWPNWSPDGERITFWTLRNDGAAELYVMDADGSNQRPLLKNNGAYLDGVWSPVTDEIAYYAYGASGRAELFTISAETKQITPIETNIVANNIFSDWSPDGEWLILHTDFNGADDIYIVRKDGSEQQRLTNSSADDQHPVWQPRNRVAQPIRNAEAPPTSGELIVWHSFTGGRLDLVSAAFDRLEQDNPGLTISAEFIDGVQMRERFASASTDGTTPDIMLAPVDWGGEFWANGWVQDPTPLLPDSVAQRIGGRHLANVRIGHNAVGVPLAASGVVLMRNQTLVSSAPTSFEEIVALGPSAYDLERGLYYSGATLNALGGRLMDADGRPAFNTAAGVAWLNALKQFGDSHSYGDQDLAAFEQGQVGIVLDATWNVGRLANAIGAENLVIDPWPTGMSGYVIYDVAYVRNDLKFEKRPLVTQFFAELLGASVQSALAEEGHIPVVRDAVVNNSLRQQAQAVLNTSVPLPIAPEMAMYWEPLTDAINDVVDGGADPAAVLETVSAEIESTLP